MNWDNIGSGKGLLPVRRQAITRTNAGPLGTNLSEIRIGILPFSFKKIHLKMSSAKMVAIYPGGDELTQQLPRNRGMNNLLHPFSVRNYLSIPYFQCLLIVFLFASRLTYTGGCEIDSQMIYIKQCPMSYLL